MVFMGPIHVYFLPVVGIVTCQMSLFACAQAVPIATTVLKALLQATLGTDRGPMGPCLGPYPSLTGLGKGGFLRDFQEIVHFDYFKTSLPGWCSKVFPMQKSVSMGQNTHKGS